MQRIAHQRRQNEMWKKRCSTDKIWSFSFRSMEKNSLGWNFLFSVAFPIVFVSKCTVCISHTWLFVIAANYILIIGAFSGSQLFFFSLFHLCVSTNNKVYCTLNVFFCIIFCSVHGTFVSMCQDLNRQPNDVGNEFFLFQLKNSSENSLKHVDFTIKTLQGYWFQKNFRKLPHFFCSKH